MKMDRGAWRRQRAVARTGAGLGRTLAALTFALLLVAACDRSPSIDAPPPAVANDDVTPLPPLAPSVVESQIRYDLAPAVAALERAVPRTFGDIDERLEVPANRRVHVAFEATRSPFALRIDSQRVRVTGVIEYEGRGWYRPVIGPEVSAACGTGDVDRPRARIGVESILELRESWQLAARSRVTHVTPFSDLPRDKCRVTIFRVDVTDRVMRAARSALEKEMRTLDIAIAEVHTRERFERWWRDISRPIKLTDSVYLTIQPRKVQLGRVTSDSGQAIAHLRLEATPRISTGNRPSDFELFTPLPPLRTGPLAGTGLRVSLEGQFGYDVATGLLRRALVGRTLERANRAVQVRDVTLSGIGGGRVALGVRFDGAARGLVYLTGTPRYDNTSDQIVIPDLAYDLRTTSLLVKGLAFLGDDQIRDVLRQLARFPVQGQIDQLRQLAVRGMNRTLAAGVELVASLDSVENIHVTARRGALQVRADAGGEIRLDIARPPPIGRPGERRPRAPTP